MGKDGVAFSVVRKKNPFQKHKEEEKEKKQRAEAEAAALYDEFVASFEADESGAKAFVRGETIVPGSAPPSGGGASSKKSKKYVPSFMPPSLVGSSKPEKKEEKSVFNTSRPDKSKPKGIDLVLEEMKKESERRAKAISEGRPSNFDTFPGDSHGSFDDGDPFTTNLYVGNLAPEVDEEVLKREFGQFGPIASVKVMWPRSEEERRRGRNCGFVAFMARDGAQAARDTLHSKELYGHELHIGWGKSVPLPAVPIWPPPEGLAAGRLGLAGTPSAMPPAAAAPWASGPAPSAAATPQQGAAPLRRQPPLAGRRAAAAAQVGLPGMSEKPADPDHDGVGPDIVVAVPDARERFIIDTLADYVSVDGSDFEQVIMEKERNNPEYGFLYDLDSPAHAYYRWRLYSLLQGDTLRGWRAAPFVMVAGGCRWVPPRMMTTETRAATRTAAQTGGTAALKDRGKPLSDTQRDRFEDMLRSLTLERDSICQAMAFCLDNAESYQEVTETLSEALTLSETPANLKVARLFLVSDVLHNSSAPVKHASNYRTRLQENLPDVFESLAECYRSCTSRMTQETLRRHVLRVLRVWRGWFAFSDDFLNGLQATFLYIGSQAAASASPSKELEEELTTLSDDSLDRRCRLGGLSTAGGRDRQIARLLALDCYLKGDTAEPLPAERGVLEETGQADDKRRQEAPAGEVGATARVLAAPRVKRRIPKGTVSKWAMMDDHDGGGGGDDSDGSGDIFSGDEGDTPPSTPAGGPLAAAAAASSGNESG
eukprot:CAMPEP_0117654630 /NCGR_PEP_ID=MMETSP0804-20121206/3845_1 /TAXON_ID=1074897 /ORGANISM="Tetraselmis astigmatica, Strain CCMP880" /LENGTH=766 /DNA_ID=CAMNT_0005460921 /DNA_START=206 /DNA_END=2503 /DNA_ORIENTATION=+